MWNDYIKKGVISNVMHGEPPQLAAKKTGK